MLLQRVASLRSHPRHRRSGQGTENNAIGACGETIVYQGAEPLPAPAKAGLGARTTITEASAGTLRRKGSITQPVPRLTFRYCRPAGAPRPRPRGFLRIGR
jgi:hypothetical protein